MFISEHRKIIKNMNSFDFFEKIYYINLDSRKDRKEKVLKEFNKYNINAIRKSPVTYKHENKLISGRMSLFLTTIDLVKDAVKNNYKNILLFEDDVVFLDRNLIENIKNSTSELPKNWELFFLSANLQKPTIPYSKHLSINVYSFGTQSYAINHTFYDKFLSFEDRLLSDPNFVIKNPIDDFYGKYIFKNNKSFISKPLLTTQANDYSDIWDINRPNLEKEFIKNEKIFLR